MIGDILPFFRATNSEWAFPTGYFGLKERLQCLPCLESSCPGRLPEARVDADGEKGELTAKQILATLLMRTSRWLRPNKYTSRPKSGGLLRNPASFQYDAAKPPPRFRQDSA